MTTPTDSADELARALELSREYVFNASQRFYDGTGGQAIRNEATRRLALIDEALAAYRTRPAPGAAGEADARGWSIEYRPGGKLHGLFDTQEEAQAEADKVGGTARAVALYTAPAPAQRMSEPPGWRLETGVGGFGEKGDRWVCVRNLESQCGQDFYEDRDPLIFNFLAALCAAWGVKEGDAA